MRTAIFLRKSRSSGRRARIWSRVMAERFGAQDPRSLRLRFHAQTAGVSLAAQQPQVNLARTAAQALSAVLGGAQSLHANSLDEAYALPTEEAALLALRTQQVIAHETGVVETVDPFAGSYLLRREADQRTGRALLRRDRQDRQSGRHGRRRRTGLIRKPKSPDRATSFNARSKPANGRLSGSTSTRKSRARRSRRCASKTESLAIGPARCDASSRAETARRRRKPCSGCSRTPVGAATLMPAIVEAVRPYATLGEMCGVLRSGSAIYEEEIAV